MTKRMDYLAWLGIDAIWLSPFFCSPMYDHGYDVSDYCDVDPLFGRLADFDDLVVSAHDHGIRVIIDWVPAHTSSEHSWFKEARRSRDDAKRSWYVWRDPIVCPDGSLRPPNNWVSDLTEGGPAWTLDETTGQYYLHSFLPQQPDLHWGHPDVVEAMHEVLRFWMDRGVDGFRADVINNIGKDPELPNVDQETAIIPHVVLNDVPQTHPLLRGIRRVVDSAPHATWWHPRAAVRGSRLCSRLDRPCARVVRRRPTSAARPFESIRQPIWVEPSERGRSNSPVTIRNRRRASTARWERIKR